MNIKILMGMSSYFLSTLPDFILLTQLLIIKSKSNKKHSFKILLSKYFLSSPQIVKSWKIIKKSYFNC